MQEKDLTFEVRKDIVRRANNLHKSVQEHLDTANSNYCVKLVGDDTNFANIGGILSDGGEYLVYGELEGALNEINILYLTDGAVVITEDKAIEIMCQAECRTILLCGFAIKQLDGGSIEIRSMAEINGKLYIEPVVGNTIKIHSNPTYL